MSKRREVMFGVGVMSSVLFVETCANANANANANAAGLPPEDKPKLCDDACEKELENVW